MHTIKDVALRADVSVKTVSRYLNSQANVSDRVKLRIEAAMKDLEYYPSAAATSLRKQSSGIISLLTENLTITPDSFEIVAGIQSVCERAGKLLLIGETAGSQRGFDRLIDDFMRHRTEAIIYATVFHKPVALTAHITKTPVILVNCFEKVLRHATIIPDDECGGYEATKTLLNSGHKRICHLTLYMDMPAAKLRLKGYKKALKESGIPFDQSLVQLGVTPDQKDEYIFMPELLESVLKSDNPPTAFLCGNDKMAMRVFMLVRRMGYKIPEDISVVGYDNYSLIAENLLPQLTTVQLPYFEMGVKAAELAVSGVDTPTTYKIKGEVIKRDSVATITK